MTRKQVDEMVLAEPQFREFHESAIERRQAFLLVKEHFYELSHRTRFLVNSLNALGEPPDAWENSDEEDDLDETIQ